MVTCCGQSKKDWWRPAEYNILFILLPLVIYIFFNNVSEVNCVDTICMLLLPINVIDVNATQVVNALSPIEVTEDGIVIEVNLVQL